MRIVAVSVVAVTCAQAVAQVTSVHPIVSVNKPISGLPIQFRSIDGIACGAHKAVALTGSSASNRLGRAAAVWLDGEWGTVTQFQSADWLQATFERDISVAESGDLLFSGEVAVAGPGWRDAPPGFTDALFYAHFDGQSGNATTAMVARENDSEVLEEDRLTWLSRPRLTGLGDMFFLASARVSGPALEPIGQRIVKLGTDGYEEILGDGDIIGDARLSEHPGVTKYSTSRSGDTVIAVAHAGGESSVSDERVVTVDLRGDRYYNRVHASEGISPTGMAGIPWKKFRHIAVSDSIDCDYPQRVLVAGEVSTSRLSDGVLTIDSQIVMREGSNIGGLTLQGSALAVDMNSTGDWACVWTAQQEGTPQPRPALFFNGEPLLAVNQTVDTDSDSVADSRVFFVRPMIAMQDAAIDGSLRLYCVAKLGTLNSTIEVGLSEPDTLIELTATTAPKPCRADRDGDGISGTQADLDLFMEQYLWEDPIADVDCSGVVDVSDLEVFVLMHSLGCQ